MSTVVAATLSNGTVSTSTANCILGSARAWVNFNGTGTVAIRDSYNVSSITDNGTGDYTVNFTNALPNANYCPTYAASASQSIVDSNGAASHIAQPYSNTTSSHRLKTRYTFSNSNGAFVDFEFLYVAIFSS